MQKVKRVILKRISRTDRGTFGVLEYNGYVFAVTAELEDLCNIKGESCIPDGYYVAELIRRPSNGKKAYMLRDVKNRDAILFHSGNFPEKDSEGCILVGSGFSYIDNKIVAITDSAVAYDRFMLLMDNDEAIHITIKNL